MVEIWVETFRLSHGFIIFHHLYFLSDSKCNWQHANINAEQQTRTLQVTGGAWRSSVMPWIWLTELLKVSKVFEYWWKPPWDPKFSSRGLENIAVILCSTFSFKENGPDVDSVLWQKQQRLLSKSTVKQEKGLVPPQFSAQIVTGTN